MMSAAVSRQRWRIRPSMMMMSKGLRDAAG
jgi:hypothetical protein